MSRHQRPNRYWWVKENIQQFLAEFHHPKKWANKSAESRQSHISGGYLVSRRRFCDLAERESDLLPFGFVCFKQKEVKILVQRTRLSR